MISATMVDRIMECLWPSSDSSSPTVWAILDCARDTQVYPALLSSQLEHIALYAGQLPNELRVASPYLVELAPGYRLTRPLLERGWGQSWGIFLRVADARNLRHHLRSFLRVKDEDGRTLVFRYYDPRVLRAYLPTCNTTELKTIFGPISSFVMEGNRGESVIEFSTDGSRLLMRQTALNDARETA